MHGRRRRRRRPPCPGSARRPPHGAPLITPAIDCTRSLARGARARKEDTEGSALRVRRASPLAARDVADDARACARPNALGDYSLAGWFVRKRCCCWQNIILGYGAWIRDFVIEEPFRGGEAEQMHQNWVIEGLVLGNRVAHG